MKQCRFLLNAGVLTIGCAVIASAAGPSLSERIGHSDPQKYETLKNLHGGPGQFDGMFILDSHALDTNLNFLHRAVIQPHSGVGAHFHNQCEEMFVIFDGEAQFTIDGRTSVLKGPAGALCRMGHSHAIYNPTDKPIQWLNINVGMIKGASDAFNLNDPRQNVPIDPIPQFMTMHLDHNLLKPADAIHGGTGTAQYRRVMNPSQFTTPWAYVDQLVLPPGASSGTHMSREDSEAYYVISGEGKATIYVRGQPADSAEIHAGDAVPIRLSEINSFENTGTEPLELLIIGVSRDTNRVIDSEDVHLNPESRHRGGASGR